MQGDIRSSNGRQSWLYSDIVKEHFFHPRNFLNHELKKGDYNAIGRVGSPACGDELKMWLFICPKKEIVQKCWWKTFGCASAIASASIASVMVMENGGMSLHDARSLCAQDIMKRLGGLPPRKVHCSVLADKALRSAINDYYRRIQQFDKIEPEATRIIDRKARLTDKDVEQAFLHGAQTLDDMRKSINADFSDPTIVHEINQLISFLQEKYSLNT